MLPKPGESVLLSEILRLDSSCVPFENLQFQKLAWVHTHLPV